MSQECLNFMKVTLLRGKRKHENDESQRGHPQHANINISAENELLNIRTTSTSTARLRFGQNKAPPKHPPQPDIPLLIFHFYHSNA